MPSVHRGLPDDGWDTALRTQGGHFLQSSAWIRVQAALGHETLWCAGDSWSWAGAVGCRTGIRYAYMPHGPTCSDVSLPEALRPVRSGGVSPRLDFIRLEPMGPVSAADLVATGAHRVRPVQPVYTWVLDLEPDENALRSQLTAGHRGSINAAERRGLTFRESRDVADAEIFIDLIHRTGTSHFHPQSDRYYRTLLHILLPLGAATLHVADCAGQSVAAAIGFDFADTRFYAHAAADPASRKLSAAAPLVWRMILSAKAAGQRNFDFWGVLPEPRDGHPWAGLSQFKKAFGGRLVERAGTWEVPVRPARHAVYALLRRLGRQGHGE